MATSKLRWWESNHNLGFKGAVATGVLVALIALVPALLPVKKWIIASGLWLVRPVQVPFAVLLALIAILLVILIRALLRLTASPPPAWLDYRQDNLLGIVWRWGYFAEGHIRRSSLVPYCPSCTTRIRPKVQGYRASTTILFICEECHFQHEIPGDEDQVIDRICALIEREANRRAAAPRPA